MTDSEDWKSSIAVHLPMEMKKHEDTPRMCILVCGVAIELLINRLVEEHCSQSSTIGKDNRSYTLSVRLVILRELDVIDQTTFEVLNWFRKLRNKAAHEAIYEWDANTLRSAPWQDIRKATGVFDLCMLIYSVLWNQNSSLFTNAFSL